MTEIKFGVIGTNFISDKFLDAVSKVDGVSVSGVLSRTVKSGSAFAARHGIPDVYTEIDKMLADENINAVYIASPNFLHKEHAVRALRAGKNVLCEKSIATDYSEFLEMKSAMKDSGCVLLEAMRPAHDPAILELISNIEKVGSIRRAHFEFCKYSSRYDKFKNGIIENAFDPGIKNSALHDIGIYPLWLAVKLFGEPINIQATSVRLSNGFDGAGEIVMDYGDKIATVSYSKITEGALPSYIEGENGTLLIDKISEPGLITLKMRGEKSTVLYSSDCENNMIFEISAFRDMIRGRIDNFPFIETSEALMRTVDRAVNAQRK